jgi:CBS domain-containing protein
MKAMDVMSCDVVTIGPNDDIADAIKLLMAHDISALPVVDSTGAVVGVISEADLMRRPEIGTEKHHPWWLEAIMPAAHLAHDFAKAHGCKVAEVMSDSVISVSEETSLGDVATLLEKHRIKRLPVLRDGKLVGIVSRSNLIQALASSHIEADSDAESDRAIRLKLLELLAGQRWTDFGSRNVIVRNGVVRLWGLISSDDERKALLALAEQVHGVKKVIDETIPGY